MLEAGKGLLLLLKMQPDCILQAQPKTLVVLLMDI